MLPSHRQQKLFIEIYHLETIDKFSGWCVSSLWKSANTL